MSDFHTQRYQIKGRGVTSNPKNRFEDFAVDAFDDGWSEIEEDRPLLRTKVHEEHARSMVTYNRSPDLPFDRSFNPYRGCEHGCVYCFARPSHSYLGFSAGLDFETQLSVRKNAAEILRKDLQKRSYKVATIALGTNTDPYQPIEKKYEVTRACLNVLNEVSHPVAIVTRGTLIERDLDILANMAQRNLVRVGVSVTTLNGALARRMEPRAPAPNRRLLMIKRLSEAGIPVRVMASPMIPSLTDHELEDILKAGREAGATSASWIMLRLPREVSSLFEEFLTQHEPSRKNRVLGHLRDMHDGKLYSADWHKRMQGTGPYAALLNTRFHVAVKKLGLATKVARLDCSQFLGSATQGQLSLL